MNKRFLLAACAFTLLLLTVFGCNTPVVESTWPKSKTTADGYLADWEGLINYSLCDQFGIGIANDSAYLYLRLVAEDRRSMIQVLRNGMTAWFRTNGKKKQLFGLRFPVGGAVFPRGSDAGDTEVLRERIESTTRSAEILGPGKHDSLFLQTQALEQYGILARLFPQGENLIYEARIPLHSDSMAKHAINPAEDGMVTIVFDSPAPQFGSPEHRAENGGLSGRGGGMGGMRGGMGGGGFRAGRPPVQPIDAKIEVRLAAKAG